MRKPRFLYVVHVADYKVWSGYFGQFMYMCVVVHCAQHRGISTTGAFIHYSVFKMHVLYLAAYTVPGSLLRLTRSLKHVFSHDICSDYLLLQFMCDCGSTCRRNRTSCWPSSWLSNCLRVAMLMNWAPPLSMTSTLKWIII